MFLAVFMIAISKYAFVVSDDGACQLTKLLW